MSPGFRLTLSLCVMVACGALGQEVDERYVEIYNLIQKADTLREAGQTRAAIESYQEAEGALKNLQASYPLWNEKVINYRLGYIVSRLAALGPPSNSIPAGPIVASSPTNQVRELELELQRLQTQNSLLEAKLREALSVQPAANDPRQLARAEQQITQLEKERDLLRVTLDQEKGRAEKPVDPRIAMREQQILAEVQQRLTAEMQTSAALRKENEELRGQISSARSVPASSEMAREVQLANATIAALQSTNIALRTERILLEERLAEISRPVSGQAESEVLRATRQERDELQKRLDLAMVQLASLGQKQGTPADPSVQRELENVRARLAAYEAKQIPYSPEELALFKQADLKVALFETNSPPKRATELPPGAGQLMAQAQSAMEKGQMPEAERLLLQVLRQDESNVYTLATLASVQMEQKRYAEAEQNLRRALAVEARDPASLFLLGRLKYDQQKYDEALDALSLSAKLIPDEPRTQFLLGKTLIQKGSRGPAEVALRKAVQLKPGWGEAHHSLAVVYATQEPPFIELAQWHYQKARAGGFPRDQELEKWIEQKKVAATP